MSYSYIKSVFPNFKNSNNFGLRNIKKNPVQYNVEPEDTNNDNIEYKKVSQDNDKKNYLDIHNQNEISDKNNLYFYKPTVPDVLEKSKQHQTNENNIKVDKKVVENFKNPLSNIIEYLSPGNKSTTDDVNLETDIPNLSEEDTTHINHVLSCKNCMNIIEKQLNIRQKQNIKQEFFEMISYILFGIFILLLLENRRR